MHRVAKKSFKTLIFALLGSVALSSSALAEMTLSVYGGANFSPHSSVDYNLNDGAGPQTFSPSWDGASFEFPPYYGIRGTWWMEDMPNWGIALDFTHSKVKANVPINGFGVLEFTDGINFFTANALYRWDETEMGLRPYAGLGAGFVMPRVEVVHTNIPQATDEFQLTGAAFQAMVGAEYAPTDDWSVFGELKSSYGMVDADLNGGGSLETNIISNQVILGVTYKLPVD